MVSQQRKPVTMTWYHALKWWCGPSPTRALSSYDSIINQLWKLTCLETNSAKGEGKKSDSLSQKSAPSNPWSHKWWWRVATGTVGLTVRGHWSCLATAPLEAMGRNAAFKIWGKLLTPLPSVSPSLHPQVLFGGCKKCSALMELRGRNYALPDSLATKQ